MTSYTSSTGNISQTIVVSDVNFTILENCTSIFENASISSAAEMAHIVSNPQQENLLLNASLIKNYLETMLGPQRLNLSTLLPISIVYGIIFITGIVGNICTCMVIVQSPHMQTATNFYLFSLSIADIVSLILGLPNDLTVYWHQYPYVFGPVICSLRALVSEMTNNASVLTIVAFTVERWLAICHPLQKQKMSNLSRVVKIIAFLWLIAFFSAIPFAIFTEIRYINYPPDSNHIVEESAFCAMTSENNHHNMPLLLFSSFVFFVIPLLFITFLYCLIGLELRKARLSRLASESYSGNSRQHSKKVLKILVSVVVAFFLCWAPFHAQRLMFVYVTEEQWEDERLRDLNEKLYYVAGCFYYFNCIINPILYILISEKYRRAFRDTVYCCCYRRSSATRQRPPLQYYCSYSSQGFSLRQPKPTVHFEEKIPVKLPKTFDENVSPNMKTLYKSGHTVSPKELANVALLPG